MNFRIYNIDNEILDVIYIVAMLIMGVKKRYSFIFSAILLLCVDIKSQSAQFVINYSNYDTANIADAVIAASYLLKDTKDNLKLKDALEIFKQNNIKLKFKFCKNKNLEKCLEEKKLNRPILSYIFFKALKLKGGLTIRIFGVIPRYAYKELVYLGFFRGGVSGQYVTKIEILNVLTQAIEYKNNKK